MYLLEHLHDINNFYSKILRSIGSQNNLTFEQSKLLIAIPFDGISLSDLASNLGIDNSTLTRNIQKLKEKNKIKINFDCYDKRKKILSLSNNGMQTLKIIENNICTVLEKLNEYLDVDDIQKIQNSLEKFNWSLSCLNNE